jgi:hypothetical protein
MSSDAWMIVLLAGLCGWIYFGDEIRQRFRRSRARSWPTTTARIESGRIEVNRGRGGGVDVAFGNLAFSYSVGGEYYSGSYRQRFRTDLEARAFVDNVKGKEAHVRYKPSDPRVSVLIDEAL